VLPLDAANVAQSGIVPSQRLAENETDERAGLPGITTG